MALPQTPLDRRPQARQAARRTPWLLAAAAGVLAAGCSAPGPGSPTGVACGQLGNALAALPQLRVTDTRNEPADDKGHPAHCLVRGQINERPGEDGKRYAIGFEMRMPQGWNQRFLHQVNGGNDGVVVPAFGAMGVLQKDALARGFAVVSSDSGHNGADEANLPAGLARGNVFGLDFQARRDYGHSANAAVWPVAQALIERHYGQKPQKNYMAGCSNGGRHAMVSAMPSATTASWPVRPASTCPRRRCSTPGTSRAGRAWTPTSAAPSAPPT